MSEPSPLAAGFDRWRRGHGIRAVPEPEDEPDGDMAADLVYAAEIAHSDAVRRWHRVVPQEFHGADLRADFRGAPWFDDAARWAYQVERRNVIIMGPTGSGKTRLAAALIRPASNDGLDVLVVNTAQMFDRLRPDGPDGYLDDLIDVERLVVDDVGADRSTEWARERWDLLVDSRWSEQRPTIYTTNLPPRALADHVGERAYSRMQHRALGITMMGRDRRRS